MNGIACKHKYAQKYYIKMTLRYTKICTEMHAQKRMRRKVCAEMQAQTFM